MIPGGNIQANGPVKNPFLPGGGHRVTGFILLVEGRPEFRHRKIFRAVLGKPDGQPHEDRGVLVRRTIGFKGKTGVENSVGRRNRHVQAFRSHIDENRQFGRPHDRIGPRCDPGKEDTDDENVKPVTPHWPTVDQA